MRKAIQVGLMLLTALLPGLVLAQSNTNGVYYSSGTRSGGVTVVSGSGVAGRCALFGGSTSLTSDSGCTYAGTGATFALTTSLLRFTSANVTGSGGAGFIDFIGQSSVPSTPGVGHVRFYDDLTDDRMCFLNAAGGGPCWDFTTQSVKRRVILPNASGTMALESSMPLGTGTAVGDVWRRISSCNYYSATGVTTTGTVEEVLRTCTIPANTLTRDGISAIRVTAKGVKAANANAVSSAIRFGGVAGTAFGGSGTYTTSGTRFTTTGEVVRLTATTQWASSTTRIANTVAATPLVGSPVLDLTTDIAVVVTGLTSVAAGDITVNEFTVDVLQ